LTCRALSPHCSPRHPDLHTFPTRRSSDLDLAAFHRRRHRPRIVAVTGSNGKTTTKEMLAAILERGLGPGRVLRTIGTQNNLVGLPLTLLRMAGTEEAAILELGMNGPGEIWRLA